MKALLEHFDASVITLSRTVSHELQELISKHPSRVHVIEKDVLVTARLINFSKVTDDKPPGLMNRLFAIASQTHFRPVVDALTDLY